jgi:multiple sugar transport system permease protein
MTSGAAKLGPGTGVAAAMGPAGDSVAHYRLTRLAGLPAGVWFVAPAVLIIGVFFLLPTLAAVLLSLTDYDKYALASVDNLRWIGIGNYVQWLTSPRFWKALRNTLFFVLVGGPLSIGVSLGAALLLESQLTRFKTLWRTIFFAPVATSLVAVAVVWRYLYHGKYGLINHAAGQLGIEPIDWLGDPRWAMPAIILLAAWKNFGYNMVLFMAGLQAIPVEVYEAAAVDGARPWQRFWQITLPSLGPTCLFVTITTMIGYFQLFSEPYVMTQGGPQESTLSLVMLMYEGGFRWWQLGRASAIACLLLLITLAATLMQLRLQRERTP